MSLGVWEQTVDRCEVLLPDAVAQEVKYYSTGERQARIELESAFHSGSMRAVSVTLERLEEFRRRFRPTFLERLDPGEAEALAYLTLEEPEASISSADKIVWRTLGVLGMGEQGSRWRRYSNGSDSAGRWIAPSPRPTGCNGPSMVSRKVCKGRAFLSDGFRALRGHSRSP